MITGKSTHKARGNGEILRTNWLRGRYIQSDILIYR